MSFGTTPLNWKDLQNKVTEIFNDMGCKTYTEKNVETEGEKVPDTF